MSDKKIVIAGLENSGKTSIAYSLRGDINLLSLLSLTPTQEYKVENFDAEGIKYHVWDLAGQQKFRESRNDSEFLDGADKVIFVIDIQDTEKYDMAIEYMEQFIKQVPEGVEISIFLHKSDPQFDQENPFEKNNLVSELINKIKIKMPPNVKYKLFKTSIYTVFDKMPISL